MKAISILGIRPLTLGLVLAVVAALSASYVVGDFFVACAGWRPQKATPPCGVDIETPHVFGRTSPVLLPDVEPEVRIMRLEASGSGTTITIQVTKANEEGQEVEDHFYSSSDGGASWFGSARDYSTNIPVVSYEDQLRSCVDPQVVYGNSFPSDPFRRSFDGGVSWETVTPDVEALPVQAIGLRVVSSSFVSRCRGYAMVLGGLYRTDDCAKTFKVFSRSLRFAIESRSSPVLMYAVSFENEVLRSEDAGRTWRLLPVSKFLNALTFVGGDLVRRSFRLDARDVESPERFPVLQIDTAPDRPERVYILSAKGLLRSDDGGDSFRVLPSPSAEYHGINQFAVSPRTGDELFASVGLESLYKSSDGGCSWQKVHVAVVGPDVSVRCWTPTFSELRRGSLVRTPASWVSVSHPRLILRDFQCLPPSETALFLRTNGGCPESVSVYGMGGKLLVEGNWTAAVVKNMIYFNGQLVARHDEGEVVRMLFKDHFGSTRSVVKVDPVAGFPNWGESWLTVELYDYNPYGGLYSSYVSDPDPTEQKFAGKERDGNSLDYFGARYYDGSATSASFRWISADSVAARLYDPLP